MRRYRSLVPLEFLRARCLRSPQGFVLHSIKRDITFHGKAAQEWLPGVDVGSFRSSGQTRNGAGRAGISDCGRSAGVKGVKLKRAGQIKGVQIKGVQIKGVSKLKGSAN